MHHTPVLSSALIHFILTVLGCAFIGTLLFSQHMGDFRTFIFTLQALFAILLGYRTYQDMKQVSRAVKIDVNDFEKRSCRSVETKTCVFFKKTFKIYQASGALGEAFFLEFGVHMTFLLLNLLISMVEGLHKSSRLKIKESDPIKLKYFQIGFSFNHCIWVLKEVNYVC